MLPLETTVIIQQLPAKRGGSCYLEISAEEVATWPKERKTRLLCHLEGQITFACGLSHLGDGNFFILLSKPRLKQLGKAIGTTVQMHLELHLHPLGIEEPDVLLVLLEQDELSKAAYQTLSDGKKRSLIFRLLKIKDIDRQVGMILDFLKEHHTKQIY